MAIYLTRSLCGRILANKLNIHGSIYRNAVNLKIIPTPAVKKLSYEEYNMKLKRPLSPHLLIYKMQLTSMLSITHRITGMILASYVGALGICSLVFTENFANYLPMLENLSDGGLIAYKFCLAFPATYHTVNGLRHLYWDMGKFLSLKQVYLTGWLMLGIATSLAVLLANL